MCRPQILQATVGFKCAVESGHALLLFPLQLSQGEAWSVNTLYMQKEPLDVAVEAEDKRDLSQ